MIWNQAGHEGADFKAQAAREPGWYWVYRPRNLGPHHYAPDDGMQLLVFVDSDAKLRSPLADLKGFSDMVCHDAQSQLRLQSWFAGPVQPGAATGQLSVQGMQQGSVPQAGWHWCKTESPLQHVDDHGVGPIFMAPGRDGSPWVWLATRQDGSPVDVGELGFAEPLQTSEGIIDGHGDAGRTHAVFHGHIASPMGVPAAFPAD